jgi:integrase
MLLGKQKRRISAKAIQLRHTAGTRFRAEFGLETARVLLGHASAATSEIYAEADRAKAAAAAAVVG